ncbi:MAG TPA: DUF948 domain-containing protein [Smithellaceae bacterium]|nr:DUF948 domain-containing protein [Smithellaceae bacterium]
MYLEISLLILGIAFLILVIFCIPILVQVWRTAKDITITLNSLNSSLPLLLKNMEEITTNINKSTAAVNQEVQYFSLTLNRFNSSLAGIADDMEHLLPLLMNTPVYQKIRNVVAVIKGVRAFLDVLTAKE